MSSESDVDATAVEEYVTTVQSALDEDPSMSARTAELRVTQPLLDVLGWDLHGGAVVAGFDTPAGDVGFALRADGRPRALVETVAPDEGMAPADGDRLLDAMRAAGVDRGLLLDGHDLAVLALHDGERDHRRVALSDLPDHRALLERFTPEALAADERTAAARALAERRDAVVADLTDRLSTATEGRCEPSLRRATETYLDQLIRQLGPPSPTASTDAADDDVSGESDPEQTEPDRASGEPEPDAPPAPTDSSADRTTDSAASTGTAGAAGATHAEAAAETASPSDRSAEPDSEEDGEFVVRFFEGSRSVGAVGGSAPLSALLQACQHLNRQRALFRGLSTPWEPDGLDRPVLTDTDADVDAPTRQLPTGHFLRTDLSAEEIGETVEGLAGEAGLRVMLQGDW